MSDGAIRLTEISLFIEMLSAVGEFFAFVKTFCSQVGSAICCVYLSLLEENSSFSVCILFFRLTSVSGELSVNKRKILIEVSLLEIIYIGIVRWYLFEAGVKRFVVDNRRGREIGREMGGRNRMKEERKNERKRETHTHRERRV